MLKRSDIKVVPPFYNTYINQVDDLNLMDVFQLNTPLAPDNWINKASQLGDAVYAPNKWTVKQIFQHIIDAERVFAYRALRIARNDNIALPGFDENHYVTNANVEQKTIQDLVLEFNTVRLATMLQYLHLGETELRRVGNCSNVDISVLALGFTMVGHQIHHLKVIEERYFPLLNH